MILAKKVIKNKINLLYKNFIKSELSEIFSEIASLSMVLNRLEKKYDLSQTGAHITETIMGYK